MHTCKINGIMRLITENGLGFVMDHLCVFFHLTVKKKEIKIMDKIIVVIKLIQYCEIWK